ncbi:hypothetical protein [Croceitalea vernalis]|uniref:Uncharacterized protein n=1 Tax=Croceitalea vernalis TaxID=3075599 RepID=A0ABU3BCJ1_9FLAO|nr:hypothetical protein [Croceitalea sp. P007]MDT0620179.1 hypothetical protein [Croceitalea sp. P007]
MVKHSLQIIYSLSLSLLFSCTPSSNDALELTEEINAVSFKLDVPAGWSLQIDQGIDTYIGRIANESDTIFFDYGFLSFGGLDLVDENDNTISFERTLINGIPSIIVKENTPYENSRSIRLSAYIDSGDRTSLNRLYCFDPSDEATIRAIMKSHVFLPITN